MYKPDIIEKLVEEGNIEEAIKHIQHIRLDPDKYEEAAFWIYLNDEDYLRDDETSNEIVKYLVESEYPDCDDIAFHFCESGIDCLTETARNRLLEVVNRFNAQHKGSSV